MRKPMVELWSYFAYDLAFFCNLPYGKSVLPITISACVPAFQ